MGEPLTAEQISQLAASSPPMPFPDPHQGIRLPDGSLWLASPAGVMLLAPQETRWKLFHSRRWLPPGNVQSISIPVAGTVVVKCTGGSGQLVAVSTNLHEKIEHVHAMLRKYHLRRGLSSQIALRESGNLSTAVMQGSDDNDGLWTSLYVAAEAFRFGVTQDPVARQNARDSLKAMMFLETVTGIPGFVARSLVPSDDDPQKYGGEWHRSADGNWWWKGDTSSDELVGHYFASYVYFQVAADADERREIAGYIERITDHILQHGLYYVGPSGKPTTWGVWAPEKLNHDLFRFDDRGLNSLEVLSFLTVAEHLCGKPSYRDIRVELIEKHAYATNAIGQKQVWPVESVNHSDDELAFLAYYPLLQLERDADLRRKYRASIERSWQIERSERSPLFNLIYGTAMQADQCLQPKKISKAGPESSTAMPCVEPAAYDHDACVEWFREVPPDTIRWSINNSHRADVVLDGTNRAKKLIGKSVLPVSERAVMRWNGDPYELNGGSEGHERDDGAAILLPYWLGRFHRLIE